MIEDVVERHVAGRDPFHIEAHLARRLLRGLRAAPRPDARRRALAASRWPAGTSSARRSASRSTSCSAAACTSGCAPTATSTPGPGDAADVYRDPELAAERAAEYVAQGFTAIKFDPAGAYTAFDPRQPSLDELDRCERFVRAGARGGRRRLRPAVRHARAVHAPPARSASRAGSSPTTRCGSRSRRRRRRPRRWRAWRARRRSRSRPASA